MNTYPAIPIGTKMKALRTIHFMCGDKHVKGMIYIVDKDSQAYFEVNHKDYEVVD